jgi:hypothetical protein
MAPARSNEPERRKSEARFCVPRFWRPRFCVPSSGPVPPARGVGDAPGGAPERSRGAGRSGKGGGRSGDEARTPTDRPGGQTGGRPRLVVGAIARRSGGGDGPPRRRLGGQAERREEPAPGVGLGHRAQHPPPARHSGHTRARQTRTPGAGAGPRASVAGQAPPPARRPAAAGQSPISSGHGRGRTGRGSSSVEWS